MQINLAVCGRVKSPWLSWQPGKAALRGASAPDSGAQGLLWEWLMAQSWGCPRSFWAGTPLSHGASLCGGDSAARSGPPPGTSTLSYLGSPKHLAPARSLGLQPPMLSCGGGWVEHRWAPAISAAVNSPELTTTQKCGGGSLSPFLR